jgi:hypothetical protein
LEILMGRSVAGFLGPVDITVGFLTLIVLLPYEPKRHGGMRPDDVLPWRGSGDHDPCVVPNSCIFYGPNRVLEGLIYFVGAFNPYFDHAGG